MSHASSTIAQSPAAAASSKLNAASPARRKAPPAFHFLAGLATGSLSAVLLQPADLLKTRVQQSRGSTLSSTLRSIFASPDVVRNLWRGTLPSVIRTGFGSALYFATLNALRGAWASSTTSTTQQQNSEAGLTDGKSAQSARRLSSSSLPKISNSANLVTGALARGGAGLVMMPITVLKVRYESSLYGSGYSSQGLFAAGRGILTREGVRGLYAGYGATLVRDAPYAGLYVLFYEQAKGLIGKVLPAGVGSEASVTSFGAARVNFLAGCLAAATATAVTNPFDAIKTRIQLMPEKYRNTSHAAKLMLREDGLRSLFDGLGLRVARKAMSSALAWTIYEDLVRRAEVYYNQTTA